MKKSDFITTGPKSSKRVLILAHGAGAPMDSEWMNELVKGLTKEKIKCVRFEFPYMIQRRLDGGRRPPNTAKVLKQTWIDIINMYQDHEIYIGGKSMGGRMASLIVDEAKVKGLICLGFPFHAPGKDPKDRILHLESLKTKTIIIQGERDSMGTKEDISSYKLSKKIKVHFMPDGDHSLKPRIKSGFTLEKHIQQSCKIISKFIT